MAVVSGSLSLVTDVADVVDEVVFRAPRLRVRGGGVVTEGPARALVSGGRVSVTLLEGPAVMVLYSRGTPVSDEVRLVVPDSPDATLAECIEAAQVADGATRSVLEDLVVEVFTARREAQDALESIPVIAGHADRAASEASAAASHAREASVSASDAASSASRAAGSERNAKGHEDAARQNRDTARDYRDTAAGHVEAAKAHADRAGQIAGSTVWEGDRLTVNGQTSPSLTGPQGPQGATGPRGATGPKGDKGDPGVDGTVRFEELTEEQQAMLRGPAGASHWDQVEGKPDVFPPASHQHMVEDITNLAYLAEWFPMDIFAYLVAVQDAEWRDSFRGYIQALGYEEFSTVINSVFAEMYRYAAPVDHTHTMSQVTDLPELEEPTREASDRANKIAMRDDKGRLLSQNYSSAAEVLDTERELPHTLASLWAARQVAADEIGKKIQVVAALPPAPDPSTIYLVME